MLFWQDTENPKWMSHQMHQVPGGVGLIAAALDFNSHGSRFQFPRLNALNEMPGIYHGQVQFLTFCAHSHTSNIGRPTDCVEPDWTSAALTRPWSSIRMH